MGRYGSLSVRSLSIFLLSTAISGCLADLNKQTVAGPSEGLTESQGNQAPTLLVPDGGVQTDFNYSTEFEIGAIDEDHDLEELSFEIVREPLKGDATILLNADPSINPTVLYEPNQGEFGVDELQILVTDPEGASHVELVEIRITPTGDRRIMGTFAHRTCIPGLEPFEVLQIADETNFRYSFNGFLTDCSRQISRQFERGTYTLGDDLVSPSGNNVTETQFVREEIRITPIGTLGEQIFNGQAVCGFTDWIADVPKDLSGTGCNGVFAAGETMFGVNMTVFDEATGSVTLHTPDANSGGDGLTDQTRWMDVLPWFLTRQAP